LTAALVRVLDERRVGTASWLGYSMGGRVALQVALRHPERVERLVLESASPGIDDPSERAQRRGADAALADSLLRDGIEAFADRWMAQPLFASQRRLAPALLARERSIRLANRPAGLAWALRGLGAGCQASLWARLGELAVPTLVVVGALDRKYLELGSTAAARMPRAVLEVVADAGHAVHLENPEDFLAAVERFLDGEGGGFARGRAHVSGDTRRKRA
jgi:2-succinyl-6-hydroxy-2,4-cyclohexadiene-1-carboxylate synthase